MKNNQEEFTLPITNVGHKQSIEKAAKRFSMRAQDYSERVYVDPVKYFERRAYIIRHWGTQLAPGDSILELGCGDGFLGCLLAEKGFGYTGIDVSSGMIEMA